MNTVRAANGYGYELCFDSEHADLDSLKNMSQWLEQILKTFAVCWWGRLMV